MAEKHTTILGRVVYNRKLHAFSDRDIARINSHFVAEQSLDSRLAEIIRDINIAFMEAILARFGLEKAAETAVDLIALAVQACIDFLRSLGKAKRAAAALRRLSTVMLSMITTLEKEGFV